MSNKPRSRAAIEKQIAFMKAVLGKRTYRAEATYALGVQNALEWVIGRATVEPSSLFNFMRKVGADMRRRERANAR